MALQAWMRWRRYSAAATAATTRVSALRGDKNHMLYTTMGGKTANSSFPAGWMRNRPDRTLPPLSVGTDLAAKGIVPLPVHAPPLGPTHTVDPRDPAVFRGIAANGGSGHCETTALPPGLDADLQLCRPVLKPGLPRQDAGELFRRQGAVKFVAAGHPDRSPFFVNALKSGKSFPASRRSSDRNAGWATSCERVFAAVLRIWGRRIHSPAHGSHKGTDRGASRSKEHQVRQGLQIPSSAPKHLWEARQSRRIQGRSPGGGPGSNPFPPSFQILLSRGCRFPQEVFLHKGDGLPLLAAVECRRQLRQ